MTIHFNQSLSVEDLSQRQFAQENNKDRLIIEFESAAPEPRNEYSSVFRFDTIKFTMPELERKIADKGIPYTRYDYVRAIYSKEFFDAVQLVQSENPKVYIPTTVFIRILQKLSPKYLSEDEAKKLYSTIRTDDRTLTEFEEVTRLNQDHVKATSLALYYRDHLSSSDYATALYWICRAEDYTEDYLSLKKVQIADKFFDPFFSPTVNKINSTLFYEERFSKEVSEAAVRCENITELEIMYSHLIPVDENNFRRRREPPHRIEAFLEKTQSKITRLSLQSKSYYDSILSPSPLIPATLLEKNTTIREFDMGNQYFYEYFVIDVLDAIRSNPHSKIVRLNFGKSMITDNAAKKLVTLWKNNKQLIWNVSNISKVSLPIQKEIMIIQQYQQIIEAFATAFPPISQDTPATFRVPGLLHIIASYYVQDPLPDVENPVSVKSTTEIVVQAAATR